MVAECYVCDSYEKLIFHLSQNTSRRETSWETQMEIK